MNAGLDHPGKRSPDEKWRTVFEMEGKGPSVVEVLTRQLHSDDKWARIAAADALGNTGYKDASAPLVTLLYDRDHDVRFATAVALGNLGDPAARQALENACRDPNHFVRKAAEEALGRLKYKSES
ncbi:MAG: HEAT repeat protein [Methanoregulaceae archaeon PtaB.Bin056]|jgi:HEAT repeat protein|nr:MAG: HEAT repeat protein [Methanoregulaceae archaeon PtaB.Bin056]